MINALVTGAGALLGQGIIRSLRRSALDVRIVAVDPSPLAAGLHWADDAYLVPFANDPSYLPRIRQIIDEASIDIVLVGTDVELELFASARELIESEQSTKILVSNRRIVQMADDKYETAKYFSENGFASPLSARPEDKEEMADLIERVGFPLIVKPRRGARSIGVSKVDNRDQLSRAVEGRANVVVQECVGTDECEYTASAIYFDGQPTLAIVMRRDLRDGNTYRAFTDQSPSLHDITKAWGESLKPFGPANFQFRLDNDGVPKVFEINSRFSGTTPLRQLVGFDEVSMCVRHLVLEEDIVQPTISDATILRHWSETVIPSNLAERFHE